MYMREDEIKDAALKVFSKQGVNYITLNILAYQTHRSLTNHYGASVDIIKEVIQLESEKPNGIFTIKEEYTLSVYPAMATGVEDVVYLKQDCITAPIQALEFKCKICSKLNDYTVATCWWCGETF
jgi:hypothetical protein